MVRTSDQATLAVVADGAGGHQGGAEASAKVVEVLAAAWSESLKDGADAQLAAQVLEKAVIDAHEAVIAQRGDAFHSGKSTVVLLYISRGSYTVVHVGDSRLYARCSGPWECMTDDDSILHLMVLAGRISAEEAKNHPDQSRLTQAIGAREVPRVHLAQGEYVPGTEYLLCCDGFWNQLPDEEWRNEVWSSSPEQPHELLSAKVEAAYRGGDGNSDNITAVWLCNDRAPAVPAASAEPCAEPQAQCPLCGGLKLGVAAVLTFAVGLGSGFVLRDMQEPEVAVASSTVPVDMLAENPAASAEMTPAASAEMTPAASAETTPVGPATTTPVGPATTTPVGPATMTPVGPAETTPVGPAETTPVEPATTTPVEPATTTPAVPAEATPAAPAEPTPAAPDAATPAAPDAATPAAPAEPTPAAPAAATPTASAEE